MKFFNLGDSANEKFGNFFEPVEFSRVIIKKIEDIPNHYADTINEIILNEEFYKIALFLNGDFIINYVDDKSYTCEYAIYFQDQQDSAYKIEAKSNLLDMTRLSEDVQKELESQKIIKFEISEPDENVRKNYKLVKR